MVPPPRGSDAEASARRAPGAPALSPGTTGFTLHFVRGSLRLYLVLVLLIAAHALCVTLIPYALNGLVNGVIRLVRGEATQRVAGWTMRGPLLLLVALSAAEVLLVRVTGLIQKRVGPRNRHAVTRAVFHYLQHHSHRFMTENLVGTLTQKMIDVANGVNQLLWAVLTEFWPIAVVVSVSVTLLFTADARLGTFALIWALLFVAISFTLGRRCQVRAVRAAATRNETVGGIADSMSNHHTVRLFARHALERQLLDRQLSVELEEVNRAIDFSENIRWFQYFSSALLKIGVLYVACSRCIEGRMDVGQFVMAIGLALSIINETRNFSRRLVDFFEVLGSVTSGLRTIIRGHDLLDAPAARPYRIVSGRVEFRKVHFRYDAGVPVFRDLSVVIDPGQRVGLVGLSGSGKSTFVSLICRLYDPQQGEILVDGKNLRVFTQDSLRSQIGLIPQDPVLFHRTIQENICYGRPEASDDEVVRAAARAQADEFIRRLPEQYQAVVGERGVKLSGGQRQRIAIARAILKDAPLLILDEATSSLDSITEQAIQEMMEDAVADKTVIVIAHRLTTTAHLDRILVFDAGRIIEEGTHAALLARDGQYRRLWERQAISFPAVQPPDVRDSVSGEG